MTPMTRVLPLLCAVLSIAGAGCGTSNTHEPAEAPAMADGPTSETELAEATPAPTLGDEDYRRRVSQIEKQLEGRNFEIVIEKPFIVVGDSSREFVEAKARSTVRWAVDRLKRQYFANDPLEIIVIWLFRDHASYRKHALELFGDNPTTPYGYYSSIHRALIMNIATGGGTLVHEIVHPFIESNFPECPAWFNEGLASLYEQCGDDKGRIVGYPNWRLPDLQKGIVEKDLASFETLSHLDANTFYAEDRGLYYAQARYLCYYLQEHDLLGRFYHSFRSGAHRDPSGYETLKRVLGTPDMEDFQRDWETFVLELEYR